MKPEKIDQRVLDCVKAKDESRLRAGRPPRRRDVLIKECKRQIAQQDERDALRAAEIQCIQLGTSDDLSDIDEAWIELEDFAASVQDGTYPGVLTLRLLAEAILHARRDPDALLRHLGLVAPRGGKSAGNATQRLLWGRLLDQLEDEIDGAGNAMAAAQEACKYRYSETTLREWRDSYRKFASMSSGE